MILRLPYPWRFNVEIRLGFGHLKAECHSDYDVIMRLGHFDQAKLALPTKDTASVHVLGGLTQSQDSSVGLEAWLLDDKERGRALPRQSLWPYTRR